MLLFFSFLLLIFHSVVAVDIGVDRGSCNAVRKWSPINQARIEALDIAQLAAEKTAAVFQANVPAHIAAGVLVADREVWRTYMIMGTFFGAQNLDQNRVQQIANHYNTFWNNLQNPNFGLQTIQIWCGDDFIEWKDTGRVDNNGAPVMGWMDTDKVPAREMGVGFQKCANMPNTNAYSFNGGTDVVMCPFGWRNERKKNGQYTITGFKNNPAAITQNDPLDDYSIITGTILHEIYHTFMGNHNDVQVNINGQLQTAYGTYNCMQLALQNSAQTLDNCENIMLASIAMFLDGWDWYTGVATPL